MRQREKIQELPREKYVIRFEKVESRLADVFVQSTFVCKKKERRNFNGNRRYSESIDPDE